MKPFNVYIHLSRKELVVVPSEGEECRLLDICTEEQGWSRVHHYMDTFTTYAELDEEWPDFIGHWLLKNGFMWTVVNLEDNFLALKVEDKLQ